MRERWRKCLIFYLSASGFLLSERRWFDGVNMGEGLKMHVNKIRAGHVRRYISVQTNSLCM